jgi:large subunit ribosomal protein L22
VEPVEVEKTMIAKARLRYLRSSPQKTRLVVDQIRGLGVNEALATLGESPKSVAVPVAKLLRSAVANAQKGDQRVDADSLFVSRAWVDCGPSMKRFRPATFGRAFQVLHRMSHITLELEARADAAPRLSRAKRRAQADREARKRASRGKVPKTSEEADSGKAVTAKKEAPKKSAGRTKSAAKAKSRTTKKSAAAKKPAAPSKTTRSDKKS